MIVRRVVIARGTVQGVGFRPFVYRRARALGLAGSVQNLPGGVRIDVEGDGAIVEDFLRGLPDEAPPLAMVERVETQAVSPRGASGFSILPSAETGAALSWPPADTAPCERCLRELADPADRRYRHPFINCTDCGPRFTIVRALPYDRERTTMAGFALCADCRREYHDPRSRRFHAEPIACPRCGPSLIFEGGGETTSGERAFGACIAALRRGEIVAIKGAGGFHLACDASSPTAVERLRARKHRQARPLALLACDLAAIAEHATISDAERASLGSPARPIVLLERVGGSSLAPGVAPGLRELGFMLPPTPLHQLLADGFARPLVLTSGNLSDEPLARDEDEARQHLAGIADAWLFHDRPIAARIDDSLVRVERGVERTLRRARGYLPRPLPLDSRFRLLAVGADLKSAFCLVSGGLAFVSQHLGRLGGPRANAAWWEALEHQRALLGIELQAVACDLHPDYTSTRFAESLSLPLYRVQHHHAHVAACLAEHGRADRVVGVVFDGAGHGEDGAVWGGEFLVADRARARRAAHLRYVRLPGGDAAAREPWRMALAYLDDAGLPIARAPAPRDIDVERLARAMRRGVAAPFTASAGRLFDAVAALCGLRSIAQFEGQAAMELEAACGAIDEAPYSFAWSGGELDLRPAIVEIVGAIDGGRAIAEVAARFHATLAAAICEGAAAIARREQLRTVVLTGGCFQNARLAAACETRLAALGLEVLRPAQLPANDGGISLGQAAVAAARMME